MHWLKLVRWQNLVLIILTQLLAWVCIILPLHPTILSLPNFCLLALSTVLIAAAGYIINDYFDVKIDLINKPEKVILGKTIPRKTAIVLHAMLNIVAIAMAGYVAAKVHHYEWLLMQVLCTMLLWFYSTHFKRQFVSGNIVVGLLTGFTIIVLILFEPKLAGLSLSSYTQLTSSTLPLWVLVVYAFFAFLLTWMREIVKDMEDFKGDEEQGCITMPIKKGLQFSIRFTVVLAIVAIVTLGAGCFFLFLHEYYILSGYILLLLILPLIAWSAFLSSRHSKSHFARSSRLLKFIMIPGVFTLVVYYVQLFMTHA